MRVRGDQAGVQRLDLVRVRLSYNKTYGTMAVIVFLVWLWITNLAILLGLEFDAEIVRQRAIAGGLPPGREPYTEPRDTRTWNAEDARRLDLRVIVGRQAGEADHGHEQACPGALRDTWGS
ncbi:hypothetical protein SGLAM104S_00806 [Streptomyces glaucescens]